MVCHWASGDESSRFACQPYEPARGVPRCGHWAPADRRVHPAISGFVTKITTQLPVAQRGISGGQVPGVRPLVWCVRSSFTDSARRYVPPGAGAGGHGALDTAAACGSGAGWARGKPGREPRKHGGRLVTRSAHRLRGGPARPGTAPGCPSRAPRPPRTHAPCGTHRRVQAATNF